MQAEGNRQVFPSNTTSYRLTASGPGGNASASATVTVTVPPPPPPPPPTVQPKSFGSRVESEITDAFFDYDSSDLREDARNALTQDANALKAILRDFSSATVVIEGHCDERGSAEYNLGLGDRRATTAKEFLTQLGVPGRSAEDDQLRQGASAVHRRKRRVLSEEPARPLRCGPVK